MMRTRESLQEKLEEIMESRNVYFQPPESYKLRFPCITYSLSYIKVDRADNKAYTLNNRYELTLIDKDPNSVFIRKLIESFELCSFDRSFVSDNFNHFVFTLYY